MTMMSRSPIMPSTAGCVSVGPSAGAGACANKPVGKPRSTASSSARPAEEKGRFLTRMQGLKKQPDNDAGFA